MTITITSAEIINPISVAIAGVGTAGSGGSGGSQVQTDWNATTGLGVLLNKPTAVSAFTNDSGYLTEETTHPSDSLVPQDIINIGNLSGTNTGDQVIPTTLPASDVYPWAKDIAKPTYVWSEIGSKPTFATVATSGSYTDLSNLPTIPAAQVQTDWNAVSGLGVLLNKPTIITDHTALSNIGTMTHAQLETAVGLNTAKVSFDSTSSTRLANTSGTNTGDQDLSGKQDLLVSGTNIKSINGASILGSGDLVISGGSVLTPLFDSLSGGVKLKFDCSGYTINYCNILGDSIYAYVNGNSNNGFRKFDKYGKNLAQFGMDANGSSHPFCFFGGYIYAMNFGWTGTSRIYQIDPATMLVVSSVLRSDIILSGSYYEYSGIFNTGTKLLLWYGAKVYELNPSTLYLTELVQYVGVQYVVETAVNTICVVDSTNGYYLNDDLTINTSKALPTGFTTIVQADCKYQTSGNIGMFLYLVNASRQYTTFNIGGTNGGGTLTLPAGGTRLYSMDVMFQQPSWDNSNIYSNGVIQRSAGGNATTGTIQLSIALPVNLTKPPFSTTKLVCGTTSKDSLWV